MLGRYRGSEIQLALIKNVLLRILVKAVGARFYKTPYVSSVILLVNKGIIWMGIVELGGGSRDFSSFNGVNQYNNDVLASMSYS